jgi:hypothetical protein
MRSLMRIIRARRVVPALSRRAREMKVGTACGKPVFSADDPR